VKRRIAKLFGLFGPMGMDAETVADLVNDYTKVMAPQPLWAVDSACRSVIASGTKFRPGAPELLALARKAADPFRTELASINSVLNAGVYRVPEASERQRVKALFTEFIAGWPDPKRNGRKTREEAELDVASGFAHLQGPLAVGDAFKAAIGARP
jgi:hypothetical protein